MSVSPTASSESSSPELDHEESPSPTTSAEESDTSAAMLAELDTLLERMMALPVSQPEEPEPAPSRRGESPPEVVSIITVTETIAESSQLLSPSPSVSTASDDLYINALRAEHDGDSTPSLPATQAPAPVTIHNESHPSPFTEDPLVAISESGLAPHPIPATSSWLVPLLWCNRSFESLLGLIGPPGRWLNGPAGRTLVGWSGLAMLAVVLGLAVIDSLGWTH